MSFGLTRCSRASFSSSCSSRRRLHQRQRERGAVNRHVQLRKQKRNAADVVFMAVRQDQAADHLPVFLQVGEIGRDDVDAQQFRIGKHHSRIDDDDVVAVTDGHRVHAELAQSAQRNYLQLAIRHLSPKCSRPFRNVAAMISP